MFVFSFYASSSIIIIMNFNCCLFTCKLLRVYFVLVFLYLSLSFIVGDRCTSSTNKDIRVYRPGSATASPINSLNHSPTYQNVQCPINLS